MAPDSLKNAIPKVIYIPPKPEHFAGKPRTRPHMTGVFCYCAECAYERRQKKKRELEAQQRQAVEGQTKGASAPPTQSETRSRSLTNAKKARSTSV